ncbi:MAG: hypothetical protein KDF60_14780 [Calditrichaeota bacterium]|nr:hypothetical protein [Calditrichota bacterium]
MRIQINHSILIFFVFFNSLFCTPGETAIHHNPNEKKVTLENAKLKITLDYMDKCSISELIVNDQPVISGSDGIFSRIKTDDADYSTLKLLTKPTIVIGNNTVEINGIQYGDDNIKILENWQILLRENDIEFTIERNVPIALTVEDAGFPSFQFKNINIWDGAFLGYGGIAWFYLFNQKLCTYGVHSNSSVFWNSESGNGLRVTVRAPDKQVAMKYTRTQDDRLLYNISVADKELTCRYEKEKRSRFIRGKTDVWDSFNIQPGNNEQTIVLSYVDYKKEYNRGEFAGIDGRQVTNLLNTVARIGVIDKNHFGGNSWHTPYGPICLHEQYIADFAIGINDSSYVNGYKQCLDYYRDNAIQQDGRVIARWAYLDEDAIPGSVTDKGFYEAQWGILMDSNPDLVANVAQLYNISGDLSWVAGHKESCEKALDYMLNRDSNGNHLVEMMTDSQNERRGSDWIDIIWASYENAFVNAKLYYALTMWADVENQLGDRQKSAYYASYAAELKHSFNKPTTDGGFWNAQNKWYVHWREKDNSIHGDNLVVPVNFMAIVYGICDDSSRSQVILDKIEEQTNTENLFFWPICLYPYAIGEGNDWQFPFPNYENGELFLSWGGVGVEAYANYKPELALKYIGNILDRYQEDGLAFQRYGRVRQEGLGDDILAGNSQAIIGLYKAIFGINPLYNRLYLNPHLTEQVSGSKLLYNFRDDKLKIDLETGKYSVANNRFRLISPEDFGFYAAEDSLFYFRGKDAAYALKIKSTQQLSIEIRPSGLSEYAWRQTLTDGSSADIGYEINRLAPGAMYTVFVNDKETQQQKSDANGRIVMDIKAATKPDEIRVMRNK